MRKQKTYFYTFSEKGVLFLPKYTARKGLAYGIAVSIPLSGIPNDTESLTRKENCREYACRKINLS